MHLMQRQRNDSNEAQKDFPLQLAQQATSPVHSECSHFNFDRSDEVSPRPKGRALVLQSVQEDEYQTEAIFNSVRYVIIWVCTPHLFL